MAAQQIKWAASHDWFSHVGSDGGLYVWDDFVSVADGRLHRNLIRFEGSFSDLRAWAGY